MTPGRKGVYIPAPRVLKGKDYEGVEKMKSRSTLMAVAVGLGLLAIASSGVLAAQFMGRGFSAAAPISSGARAQGSLGFSPMTPDFNSMVPPFGQQTNQPFQQFYRNSFGGLASDFGSMVPNFGSMAPRFSPQVPHFQALQGLQP
jgi:hypothetical protein